MNRIFATPSLLTIAVIVGMFSSPARAHIDLLDPIPRYPIELSNNDKACPCGIGDSNRTCSNAADRSDPDRSTDRVTTLVAGSTIRLQWNEAVGHSGRYRVAFDPDGADLDDFNANILIDVPDPSGSAGNVCAGSPLWELEVTLPQMTCTNCTLQLIQMMDGNTADPVLDPVGRSTYYQCADIILIEDGEGTGGETGAEPTSTGDAEGCEPPMSADDTGDADDDDGSPPPGDPSETDSGAPQDEGGTDEPSPGSAEGAEGTQGEGGGNPSDDGDTPAETTSGSGGCRLSGGPPTLVSLGFLVAALTLAARRRRRVSENA